jgi:hypothetical protein
MDKPKNSGASALWEVTENISQPDGTIKVIKKVVTSETVVKMREKITLSVLRLIFVFV